MTWLWLWLAGCAWVTDAEVQRRFDRDGDGHDAPQWGGDDCDDDRDDVHPTAPETWYDGVDADCDGGNDFDQDGDGARAEGEGGTDCDDLDPDVVPGAVEVDNGVDDDCDGLTDETPSNTDGDGDGFSEVAGDCDDANDAIFPGQTEIFYDGVDQDCDPSNEYDRDGDGYDAVAYGGSDCDDGDDAIHPGAIERVDGVDNNCDGLRL
jgi:hypothetical protein